MAENKLSDRQRQLKADRNDQAWADREGHRQTGRLTENKNEQRQAETDTNRQTGGLTTEPAGLLAC